MEVKQGKELLSSEVGSGMKPVGCRAGASLGSVGGRWVKWLLRFAQCTAWVLEVAPLHKKLSAFSSLLYVSSQRLLFKETDGMGAVLDTGCPCTYVLSHLFLTLGSEHSFLSVSRL